MKITSIDVMELGNRAQGTLWRPIVCRINTDSDIYGYGEAAVAYGVGASAAFGMVKDLAGMIVGMDPLDTEVIWNKMYRQTFWGQNGGLIPYAGMSAIDIALWDIKGKAFGVPVYKLLGGKCRDKLRCYASQLQFGWGENKFGMNCSNADYQRSVQMAMDEGYDAVKIDFFTFDLDGRVFGTQDRVGLLTPARLEMLESRIAAVRETLGKGSAGGDIIMEAHSYPDAASAVQIGQMAEPYDIMLYEEPCTPSPMLTRMVHEAVNIPLASGERIYGRLDYMPYFEEGLLGMIQPDIGTCGGITEAKKTAEMAAVYDVGVQVHVCASPLCTAAALQLEATLPNFTIHEHHINSTITWNTELCKHNYQPVNGYYEIPDLPGIGNELSEFALKNVKKAETVR